MLASAVQYLLYARVLREALAADDVEERRAALVRWTGLMLGLGGLIAAGAGVYVLALLSRHPTGWAWIAPAVGAVIGSAVPLQIVVGRIMRSALR